ncbi:MAG: HPr-rel-A system PqqD family peptide chaperone [Actinobacteria bacterium]|nr:HPr-rel-A system PqqD family peptide chaperone [Actinomycetota bacterium]
MPDKFRLADHLVCRQTNSELRMLFDRRNGVMYELNESASAVVALLSKEPATAETLSTELLDEFDGPADEVLADVDRMLSDFVEAGMVVPG